MRFNPETFSEYWEGFSFLASFSCFLIQLGTLLSAYFKLVISLPTQYDMNFTEDLI